MKIAFNPSTVAALTTPPNNKDITFDLRGRNIFARGVKFYGTDTNTWRDIKINNVSIGSYTLDLRNGSNTTLTNTNGVVTINSTWRPVVDNLTSDSTTSSLSAKQGKVLKALIDGKSNSDHNHDGRYLKLTGGTMLGALNFANNTWNLVGDDSYIGDCNISGHFGIKAANTTYPGITFFNNASTFLGNLTAYSGNIKYGAYSLQFLDNGNTSVSASTWTNPFSNYNSNAVADGQAICVWGQSSYLSNLSPDTGDMSLWLERINANVATLNMVLDGEYYANGNQRLAHVSEIPNKDSWNYDDRYYTKAESNAKYITDIATSVNKLTFTRNGSNIARNITVNIVYSQGNLTNISNKDNTTKASSGLYIYNSYNQVIGTNSYSSVLSINTGGTIQIAGNWGDDHTRNLYWRSQSDRNVADYPWKSWRTILDSENYSSTLDSRYYTESEVNSLLDAKLNRQNLSYGNWNPRGYHLAADYYYNGGDLSISESGGKIHVSVDGYFWQNEGQYRVLDTSDVAGLKSNLTVHQFLSAADAAWYPLVWGGNSHNNTSDSTGAVYKSYDKLCWQTSSQTLYATNIQTNNIKNLSIGGGIYWNSNVESATDGSDAASITLVRSGVTGITTLLLSQIDNIRFKTNTAAGLYHNSYPILTTQNTYVSNNKGYINGTEITQVNNANKWITARTFTVGNTSKSVDGSSNVSWSLSEIGAASSNHNHDNRYVRKWTGVYGNANKFLKLVISDEKGWIRLEVSDSNNALSGGYGIYIIGWGYHGNNSTDTLFARCLYANDSRYTTALKVVRTSRNNYDFYFQFASGSSYPSYTINYSSSVSSIDCTVTAIDTIPTATWTSSLSVLQLNASQVDWSGITNKPSEFNPAAHTHTVFKNNLMIKGTNGISDSASIHLGIGDSDTGFKWISDGVCQIYANNAAVGQWTSGGMNWFKNPTVNGNKVWNAGNDGSGSGLDSDLVDGLHASRFPIYYNLNMSSTSNHWYKLGTARISESDNIMIHIYSGDGWNSNAYQNAYATLMIKTGYNPIGGLTREFSATMVNHHHSNMTYKLISPSNDTVDIWVKIPWGYSSGWYSIHGEYSSYTHSGASQSAEPTGNAQTGVETLTNAYTSSNVASATNADMVDGYHENSFLRYRGATYTDQEATLWSQIGIKQYNNALPDNLTGVYNYGSVISLPGLNSRFEIYASHQSSNGNGLYYRSGWGNDKKAWLKFIDSSNIGSQSVNYANSAGHANSAGNADTLGGIPRNYGRAPFGTIPSIENDGVMEIGRYIDFHSDNSGSYDYSTRIQATGNYKNTVNLPSASGTLALTSYGGDDSTPIFLGYLDLYHGNDGTISSSFYCLGHSVPFTYTRGGNYCKIVIPDTIHLTFYISAAIASVNYSGGGKNSWVGGLQCWAIGCNEVRVKGFCPANDHNDSWWGGNPLYSGNSGANKITVCIFGHVFYK